MFLTILGDTVIQTVHKKLQKWFDLVFIFFIASVPLRLASVVLLPQSFVVIIFLNVKPACMMTPGRRSRTLFDDCQILHYIVPTFKILKNKKYN